MMQRTKRQWKLLESAAFQTSRIGCGGGGGGASSWALHSATFEVKWEKGVKMWFWAIANLGFFVSCLSFYSLLPPHFHCSALQEKWKEDKCPHSFSRFDTRNIHLFPFYFFTSLCWYHQRFACDRQKRVEDRGLVGEPAKKDYWVKRERERERWKGQAL